MSSSAHTASSARAGDAGSAGSPESRVHAGSTRSRARPRAPAAAGRAPRRTRRWLSGRSLLMKCRKRFRVCGSLDRLLPLAFVAADRRAACRPRAPRAMPSGSSQTTCLQIIEAALEVVAPDRGALQAIGGADVEHQEAVDVADQRVRGRDPPPAVRHGAASCRRCRRRRGSSPSRWR